jgi:citrate lyase subunit gamma (acyl carrier protein)
MEIKSTAMAGTLESSDIQITISSNKSGIQIDLNSDVAKIFGKQIKKVIIESLNALEIKNAKVKAVDQGALDCVIRARTLAAAQRATHTAEEPEWEVF